MYCDAWLTLDTILADIGLITSIPYWFLTKSILTVGFIKRTKTRTWIVSSIPITVITRRSTSLFNMMSYHILSLICNLAAWVRVPRAVAAGGLAL